MGVSVCMSTSRPRFRAERAGEKATDMRLMRPPTVFDKLGPSITKQWGTDGPTPPLTVGVCTAASLSIA